MNKSIAGSSKGTTFYKSQYDFSIIPRDSDIQKEQIAEKVGEAMEIVKKAKENLKAMEKRKEKLEKIQRARSHAESQAKYMDATVLGCEMRHSLYLLEKQVSELKHLSTELLKPGYYRRNDYPHGWRLSRNYSVYSYYN